MKLIACCVCLLAAVAAANAGFDTVVIDAGHGGHDRGGVPGQRIPEKTMALDTAIRLRNVLQAAGLRTIMTRTDDTFIPLGTRVAIANGHRRGAIFISIHYNSAPRRGACGFETYYYSSQSARLAAAIHSRVVRRTWRSEDRGVRRRGFFVIRRTRIPSVLVECGFLTNPQEGACVLRPENRQRMAEAIAAGILSLR
jgi:N-acetylmuramoyl-L-alanine amidase